jgi:hypothetical protein
MVICSLFERGPVSLKSNLPTGRKPFDPSDDVVAYFYDVADERSGPHPTLESGRSRPGARGARLPGESEEEDDQADCEGGSIDGKHAVRNPPGKESVRDARALDAQGLVVDRDRTTPPVCE